MGWTDPITVNVGDLAQAAHWNTYIRDNLNALGEIRRARKSADTTRTGVTVSDDPHLIIPVAANQWLTFDAFICFTDNTTGGDLRFGFTGPTGSTGFWSFLSHFYGDSSGTQATQSTFPGPGVQISVGGNSSTIVVDRAYGLLKNGSTAGNLAFQFAEASATGVGVTVKVDSILLATVVPSF